LINNPFFLLSRPPVAIGSAKVRKFFDFPNFADFIFPDQSSFWKAVEEAVRLCSGLGVQRYRYFFALQILV
jgi:hypothetical protein